VEATTQPPRHHHNNKLPTELPNQRRRRIYLARRNEQAKRLDIGMVLPDASKEETTSIDAAKSQSRDQVFST
jgi:hypothetical protein